MHTSSRLVGGVCLAVVVVLAGGWWAQRAHAQCPATVASTTLTDGNGFLWDIQTNGSISNGSIDAYDIGMVLYVGGVIFPASAVTTAPGGRELTLGPATMSGLTVNRRVYVPAAAGWARFVEEFTNPTAAPITVTVEIQNNLGSDGGTVVTGSFSGDTAFTVVDRWLTTDDADTTGDPSMGHNVWGPGGTAPTLVGMTVFDCAATNGTLARFSVTVPAGATRRIMSLESQNANRAASTATSTMIDGAPAAIFASLSLADQATIVNWTAGSLAANGTACGVGTECLSGFCVDGVCCNGACGGGSTTDCQACAVAAGAAANGSCGARAAGQPCRAAAGACDVADSCNGLAFVCPADTFAPAGTSCRASVSACDVAEACSGAAAACPADGFAAAGTACRPSAGGCDVADACSGLDGLCPIDALIAAGTECRASAGVCDVAEACSGVDVGCPTDALAAAGTECRVSAGICDAAESCSGADIACPADGFLADGTACEDGLLCNGAEMCAVGACMSDLDPGCDDGDVCTADSCSEGPGCAHTAIAACCQDASDCDDGIACTIDSCGGTNECAHDPDPACADGGVSDDAGVIDDAGVARDAAIGGDGGGTRRGSTRSGGCGCRTAGESSTHGAAWLGLAAVGLVLARRRRRR